MFYSNFIINNFISKKLTPPGGRRILFTLSDPPFQFIYHVQMIRSYKKRINLAIALPPMLEAIIPRSVELINNLMFYGIEPARRIEHVSMISMNCVSVLWYQRV